MATILIIDDEPILLKNLKMMLEFEDFEVIMSTDGDDALRVLRECNVDLILCDMLMYPLNGFQILQAIQNMPEAVDIPFVFVTGVKWNPAEAEVSGVSGYLIKPFTRNSLLETVRAFLPT
jgi:CheY-like chemotaxis protein